MSKEASVSFEQFREALQRALDYLWEDEREDYQAAMSEPEPRRHIFEELQLLAQWLGENPKEFPREPKEYNGWANYETWCVHLWLTNEEGSYRYWREEARRHRLEAPSCANVMEGIWSVEQAVRFNLADQLQSEVEHEGGCSFSSLYADLLQAALSKVDWAEIADAFLEDIPPAEDRDEPNGEEEESPRNEEPSRPRFDLGQVASTPGAKAALTSREIWNALNRHSKGDWGDVRPEDWQENELSLREGFRLFSVYHAEGGTKFWVITEADRSSTCILLPEEY